MGENCTSCPYFQGLADRVEKLERTAEKNREDISEIKVREAAEKERVDSIFKILTEIKANIANIPVQYKIEIDKLSSQLSALQLKPAQKWETVTMDIIKYAVLLGVGLLIGKTT